MISLSDSVKFSNLRENSLISSPKAIIEVVSSPIWTEKVLFLFWSSSSSKSNYVSIEDMECATLLPRKDDSTIGKKNQSNVSLKNVAYGLGIVALACSGSFVAGRSAAQYKLSGGTSQLGVAPARLGSKASSVKHSTAHSAAAAKKAKTSLANVGEDEGIKASSVEETTQPADPGTMSKEEMAEEIKQLRGYMTSLVGDEDREV